MSNVISNEVFSDEASSVKYDECMRLLLSRRDILANILKSVTDEFKDWELTDIIKILSYDEISIQKVPVDDTTLSEISKKRLDTTQGGSVLSSDEGIRNFDIKFKVKIPMYDTPPLEMYINIEPQNNTKPGYTIERRGIYYLSRLISAQYGVDFLNSDFENIKKVYSIWICLNSNKDIANSIVEYKFTPNLKLGSELAVTSESNYNLMDLVVVHLNSKFHSNDRKSLPYMLNLLIDDLPQKGKSKSAWDELVENYNVDTSDFRGVNDMCKFSEIIASSNYKKGVEEGFQQGQEDGFQRGLIEQTNRTILNMYKDNFSVTVIANSVGKSEEYVQSIINTQKQLNSNTISSFEDSSLPNAEFSDDDTI